jgi:hypothetical protein
MPTARNSAILFVLLGCVSQSIASPAAADIPWPPNGAPLCIAPGDQTGLIRDPSGCGFAIVSWLDLGGVPAGIEEAGLGPEPPAGVCPGSLSATTPRDLSSARMEVADLLGLPGCFGPVHALLCLEGSAPTEVLVLRFDRWVEHPTQVVDDGEVTRTHPRMTGSGFGVSFHGNFQIADTAAVVVWSDDRTGVPQVFAQRIDNSGAREWGPHGIQLVPTSASQTEPEIIRLGDGSVLVAWLDARNGGSDVYALKLLPDGTAAPGWPMAGLALEARVEASSSLRLVSVDANQSPTPSYAVWEETGPRAGAGRLAVARRLLGDGTPDPAWSALGVPLSDSPTVERLQDSGTDYSGDLQAVWTDMRAASPSNPTDLYAQHLTPAGVPAGGWPADGLAICTAPGRQDHATLSTNGFTAYAWEDSRGADVDVYAELRYADGTLPCCEWLADGLPATQASGDQTRPVVQWGNAGGAFVAWVDARDVATNGLDIYAQAFTRDGQTADVLAQPPGSVELLRAPAPNPARGAVRLAVVLSESGALALEVLDVVGRRVATLAHGTFDAGTHAFVWRGLDDHGRKLPAGLYRVRARAAGRADSRSIVRLD